MEDQNLDFEISAGLDYKNEAVLIQSTYSDLEAPIVDIRVPIAGTPVPKIYKRTGFQARLGKRLDKITRKVLDNGIRLTSHPTDMLRISVKRDSRSGDLISRTITSSEIVPIIFPNMENVPLRHFVSQDDKEVLLPSFYAFSQEQYFDLYAPVNTKLDVDDLLIRFVYNDEGLPWISVLQVKDVLSTVGYNSILLNKLQCTFYDETLPDKVISLIKTAIAKREELGW